ncbi:MAG TPA: PEP/pyruvate-binding domain-containing protein, partial [Kofleriaceae bacterium]|nr:PEP/pyruvate-binding domain-containing protein [Kofleriaceae bacterium]
MTAEFLVDLAEIAREPEPAGRVGGKAARLGQLIAAGLPVPPGVVLRAGGAAAPEHLARLRAPLVVRSSAAIEDGPGGAAAGVFESVREVAHERVPEAIAAVRASAETPAARAYAAVRGVDRIEMAVIIQEQSQGQPAVVYTRAPGAPRGPTMV